MKYGIWNISQFDSKERDDLCRAGYSPLTARVLCSRGYSTPEQAQMFLSAAEPMPSAFLMQDMRKAADRLKLALQRGEHIAVFGESRVDEVAAHYELPVLAKLPIDPKLAAAVDAGRIEDAKLPDALAGAMNAVEGLL